MQCERRIPKGAVKPLLEYCGKLSEETGKPVAEVFGEYLELMKKYAEYFFSEPWPEKREKQFGLGDKDLGFLGDGRGYGDERERFILVCLRRNLSLEGFDSQGFDEDFKFYGGRECWDCLVPEAMRLREEVKSEEQLRRKIEEEMKQDEPSWFAREMHEHLNRPHVVKSDKMREVRLRFCEEMGEAEGKSCEVKNKYKCPYGEESEKFIEEGGLIRLLWRLTEWYDHHWNRSYGFRPSETEAKWYHYDEPGVIDVTSYDDIVEAIEDGRLDRIVSEHERYLKETRSESSS